MPGNLTHQQRGTREPRRRARKGRERKRTEVGTQMVKKHEERSVLRRKDGRKMRKRLKSDRTRFEQQTAAREVSLPLSRRRADAGMALPEGAGTSRLLFRNLS